MQKELVQLTIQKMNKMAYKIKSKNKEIKHRAYVLRIGYSELDSEAYLQYNSEFSQLSEKEQKAISKKVAKYYHF